MSWLERLSDKLLNNHTVQTQETIRSLQDARRLAERSEAGEKIDQDEYDRLVERLCGTRDDAFLGMFGRGGHDA